MLLLDRSPLELEDKQSWRSIAFRFRTIFRDPFLPVLATPPKSARCHSCPAICWKFPLLCHLVRPVCAYTVRFMLIYAHLCLLRVTFIVTVKSQHVH